MIRSRMPRPSWSVPRGQYTYYNSTLNSKTNITSVEEVAGGWAS